MRLGAAGVLMVGMLVVGCVGQPKLTQHRAVECLKMSLAYRNLEREAGGPVALAVKRDEDNRVQVIMLGHGPTARKTLGRFRVDPDRRIFQYDEESGQWKWITTCD